jgi:hypothetical protein
MLQRIAAAFLLISFAAIPTAAIAQESPAHAVQVKKDEAEIRAYNLTMDTIERSFATTADMQKAAKADPSLENAAAATHDGQQASLDELTTALSSSPKIVAILAAHKFTPRSFGLAEFAIVQTSLAVAVLQSPDADKAATARGLANPANIKLMQDHMAEIEALQKKYGTNE